MPRQARVVIPGVPHHVVQRGNRRQPVFFSAFDYGLYLDLAAEAFRDAGVEVWAYCLMPNHVHLIAAPRHPGALAQAVGDTHRRYTQRINSREGWSGFLWQGRFGSFPMDEDYLLTCARYVVHNPVRAGIVARAAEWPWSSLRAHLLGSPDPLLTPRPLADRIGDLAAFFATDGDSPNYSALRNASVNGRPLGSQAWLKALGLGQGRIRRRGCPSSVVAS